MRTATILVILALTASALHAQVPYTQNPFESRQPGRDSMQEILQLQLQMQALTQPSFPSFPPSSSSPAPQRPLADSRPLGGVDILSDIQRSIGQPYRQQESYYDRMMRELKEDREREVDRKLREFQNDKIERAIRCNRFGSREVYADCHNW